MFLNFHKHIKVLIILTNIYYILSVTTVFNNIVTSSTNIHYTLIDP